MPALTLFGRRWRMASDDLVFPALFDLCFTVLWLIASVIVYWRSDANLEFLDCPNGHYTKIYLYGIFTILHLIIVTSVVLVNCSKAGSIMETEKRHFVPSCLYMRLSLQLVEVGWNVLGTYWAYRGFFDCSTAPAAFRLVIGFIICNWVLVVLAIIGLLIVFDPLGAADVERENSSTLDFFRVCAESDSVSLADVPDIKLHKVWSWRLRTWLLAFHSWSSSTKNAFHESGKLFGSVFASTDLVPTDTAAGLILLALRNKDANKEEAELHMSLNRSEKMRLDENGQMTKYESQDSVVTTTTTNIPPQPHQVVTIEPLKLSSFPSKTSGTGLDELFLQDWKNPILLSHYLKYAMACYSWPLVLFDKKPGAIRRLLKNTFLCKCWPGRSHPLSVQDDDCCFCHTSGVREFSGIDDEQLVHLCFKNKVFNTPFFVAKDPATKTIILAIRGTMSLMDLLTDMTGWPTGIDYPGVPPTFKAHHGMILCAKDVHRQLESLNILPKLFEEHPDYKLVLTGTSLGAGTATIMSIMMKNQYPGLKCYAFSPPGGLLSLDAAEFCNDMVCSVVYGNDIVPRLSIRSIENLKYAIIDALKESKSPKYRILLGGLSMMAGNRPKTIDFAESTSSSSINIGIQSQISSPPSSIMTTITDSVTEIDSLHVNNDDDEESFRRPSQEHLISSDQVAISITTSTTMTDSSSVCDKKCDSNICDSSNKIDIDVEASTNLKMRGERSRQEERLKVPCGFMYMPGRIIFISETDTFRSGHNKSDYSNNSRWRIRHAERTEQQFLEIKVHGRFLGDHLPYRMYKAVRVLAATREQIGPNPMHLVSR